MAARKSGLDIQNGPISYLDDVPFKFNEKFRCPAKVGLPIGFCLPHCHSLLSEMQYDFSLEKLSVRWGQDLAKARANKSQAAKSRQTESKKHIQAASQDADAGLADGKKAHPAEEQDVLPPTLNPVLVGLWHNAILTPLPAPNVGLAQPAPSIPTPQSLNLADFEREENPFDKLELKTLDDKEELRSILQSQPQSFISAPEPPHPELCPPSQNNTPPLQIKSALFHKPNGLVGLLDFERPGGQIDAERPCNIRSLTFPKLSDPGDSSSEPSLNLYPPAPPCSLSNGTPLLLRSTTYTKSSVSGELSNHAQNGTPKQPSSVPAAGPCSYTTLASGVLLSLSPSERQCVETIVGMGYSYEGVLKAMQRQGQNVEQVLEYLFVHNRLCEQGFDATAVEECLEMYQCSEEKALQFLQLMSQFGEMGFERDAIKEVLIVHNNDQDKALEDLMARAAAS